MKYIKYIIVFLIVGSPLFSSAQEDKPSTTQGTEQVSSGSQDVAMADLFRQEGKIYVVVAVALVILIGIFVYLFMLDKKVSKIENQLKK